MTEGRGLTKSWGGFVCRKRGDGCAACSRVCSELADGKCLLKSIWERGVGEGRCTAWIQGSKSTGGFCASRCLAFTGPRELCKRLIWGLHGGIPPIPRWVLAHLDQCSRQGFEVTCPAELPLVFGVYPEQQISFCSLNLCIEFSRPLAFALADCETT